MFSPVSGIVWLSFRACEPLNGGCTMDIYHSTLFGPSIVTWLITIPATAACCLLCFMLIYQISGVWSLEANVLASSRLLLRRTDRHFMHSLASNDWPSSGFIVGHLHSVIRHREFSVVSKLFHPSRVVQCLAIPATSTPGFFHFSFNFGWRAGKVTDGEV